MMPMRIRSLAPKTLEAANVPASPVATLPMKLRRDCMGKNSLGVNNNYTTRARPVMTPEPPLGYACVSCHRLLTRRLYPRIPARAFACATSRDREGADGRDTRTTACLRARLVNAAHRYTPN